MLKKEHQQLTDIINGNPFEVRSKVRAFLETVEIEEPVGQPRSTQQNRALHLWLKLVAEELDKRGFTLQNVVEKIQKAEIRPNTSNLKETLWKPYMKAALKKNSTTKLTKHEVDVVYEGLNKFLGDNFDGLHVPFPHDENKGNDTLNSLELRKKLNG